MHARRPVDFLRVNGLGGDPAVYIFFQRTGDAALFDLGTLDRLQNRELLKVRIALVSHTHIDHFIGFDRWLRVNIPHGRELRLAGPPGLAANVQGKLRGYLWNLIDAAQLRFIVHEVAVDGTLTTYTIGSHNAFALDAAPPVKATGCVAAVSAFDDVRFDAVALDHKTPSIAYACQLPNRYHVKEDVLAKEGWQPGPWIKDAQIALAGNKPDTKITIGSVTTTAGELAVKMFEARAPRPLGYMTDAGFTRANLDRVVPLLKGVETFVCETNYKDAEALRAIDRMHLTTRQAALIAASAGVKDLEIFHVSNIYAEDPAAVAAEAASFFEEFRELSEANLGRAVDLELARLAGQNLPS